MHTLLMFLIPLTMTAAFAAELPTVLIIGYGPFDGRASNGSGTIATALNGKIVAEHRVVGVELPVQWGEIEGALADVIAEHHPAVILGLGEGFPGRVALETRAANARLGADAAGHQPPSPQLHAKGPTHLASRIAYDLDALPSCDVPVVLSVDAGTYLCNNLLWVCLERSELPAGFIHLPPQGDAPNNGYVGRFRPIIEAVIAQGLQSSPAVSTDADAKIDTDLTPKEPQPVE